MAHRRSLIIVIVLLLLGLMLHMEERTDFTLDGGNKEGRNTE